MERSSPRLRLWARRGFILTELAIVLIVVGLLVGAVLRGTELVRSARIAAIPRDVNEIRTAVATFQARYDSLPGDLRAADLAVVGTGLGPGGDGDGRIEGNGLAENAAATEATWFWQHLRAASSLPKMPQTGGGLTTASLLPSGFGEDVGRSMFGTTLVVGRPLNDFNNDGYFLTPAELYRLDRRVDDGSSSRGAVSSFNDEGGCDYAPDTGVTAASPDEVACSVYLALFE